jgi:intracellular sulfur oxidation DsrE/DsrF family protein
MIYRAVFHIDMDDPKVFALGLANVGNLLRAIPEHHYDLVVLFNGPAVTLLQTDQCAPYREEIWQLQQNRVSFKVCRNALNRFNLAPEDLVEGCELVPAGVVALIDLQQDGYAYIKP